MRARKSVKGQHRNMKKLRAVRKLDCRAAIARPENLWETAFNANPLFNGHASGVALQHEEIGSQQLISYPGSAAG